MDREQKLINDKKSLEERVKNLEEELKNQIQINKELVKKMRVIEYQMLQQKKRVKNNNPNHQHQNSTQLSGGAIGTIGTGSSGGGGTIGGNFMG